MKKILMLSILVIIIAVRSTAQIVEIPTSDSVFTIFISDSSNWKAYQSKENTIPVYESIEESKTEKDSTEVSFGFIFAPQGVIGLQYPEKGFIGVTPILAVIGFSRGKNTLKVTYNLTHNKVQIVYLRPLSEDVGVYFLVNKFIFDKGGYTAFALTRSLGRGKASLFCEVGSTWHKWSPILCTGVLIPFSFRIN